MGTLSFVLVLYFLCSDVEELAKNLVSMQNENEYLNHFFLSFGFSFHFFPQIINRTNFNTVVHSQDLQGIVEQAIDFVDSPDNSPESWPTDYQKCNLFFFYLTQTP